MISMVLIAYVHLLGTLINFILVTSTKLIYIDVVNTV